MHKPLNVAIVGARGYSGLELARILLLQPLVKIIGCFATDAKWELTDYLPEASAKDVPIYPMDRLAEIAAKAHTVFLATPAETSIELAPLCLSKGANVIDLSGAFRLEKEVFEKTYGMHHAASGLLGKARYGLVPFAAPAKKSEPALIANPGCYATSILMALVPLLRANLIDPRSIVIDAKSGTSGAGRKATDNLLFAEVAGECLPYRVGRHQHLPEIEAHAEAFSGTAIAPFFTTHLLPTKRGIIASIYARLSPAATALTTKSALELVGKTYGEAFRGYPLARFQPLADAASAERSALLLRKVVGSARTHLAYRIEGDKLYVFSLIDNLLKGAAGQAVENFNRLLDLPPQTALEKLEGTL